MADESTDMANYDGHDDEFVGGGGYIDDDIDLDDDDDDEPLASLAPKPNQSTSSLQKPVQRKRSKPQNNLIQPSAKKKRTADPDPRDYELRAMSTGNARDYIVARFLENVPQLGEDSHMRLYRENENTEDGRKQGLQAHHKQSVYYKTFAGKRRLQRYENQGIVHIMDRHKKSWKMDLAPKQVAQEIEQHRKKKIEARKKNQAAKASSIRPTENGDKNNEEEEEEDVTLKELESVVNTYTGAFDGKSTAPYCMMILNEGTKRVDVVPLDDYAWFAFRANRIKPKDQEAAEAAEARFQKMMKKKEQRLGHFQAKYEEAQMEREQAMGDNTRIEASAEYASVGIKRNKNVKARKESDDLIAEGMEFEMDFDDDDVAQIDTETVVKNENRVLGDVEQQAREFRKLIKDEPRTAQPLSPGSDSEEEPGSRDSPSRSRSVSPSPGGSRSQSPRRSPSPSNGMPSASKPPIKSKVPLRANNRRSPSPGTGRERSPAPTDVSHLLPPRGTLPNEEHVRAVLAHMLRDKTRVSFKLFLKNFERNTQVQKDNLTKILRQIAQVEADPVRSKNYYISWKRNTTSNS